MLKRFLADTAALVSAIMLAAGGKAPRCDENFKEKP
ncbi:hypothetical protein MPC1_14630002 [Methylocella tundrae]|nr:hypothetical protein MPC1_14630002 [Methylocella tundrae]